MTEGAPLHTRVAVTATTLVAQKSYPVVVPEPPTTASSMVHRALCAGLLITGCASMDRLPGEPCQSEGDCVPGASCALVSRGGGLDSFECVERCDDVPFSSLPAGRCEGGEICYPIRGDRPGWLGCFPGGSAPIGAACTFVGECERSSVCLFETEAEGSCAPVCAPAGCVEGEGCAGVGDCAENLECALVRSTGTWADAACVAVCVSPDRAADVPTLCSDGEACFRLGPSGFGPWGCYPGGEIEIGDPCNSVDQCVRGAVCWDLGSGPSCVRACAEDADCPSGACTSGLCRD